MSVVIAECSKVTAARRILLERVSTRLLQLGVVDALRVLGSFRRTTVGATGDSLRASHRRGRRDGRSRREHRGQGAGPWSHRCERRLHDVGSGRQLLGDRHPDRVRDNAPGQNRGGRRPDHRYRNPDPVTGPDAQPDRGDRLTPPGKGARCPGVGCPPSRWPKSDVPLRQPPRIMSRRSPGSTSSRPA